MRLTEIQADYFDDVDPLFKEQLVKNCSTIVKSKTHLYRGTGTHTEPYFTANIRTDRVARNSRQYAVWGFDALMEALGYPHRKSNTLSTTTNRLQSASYTGKYEGERLVSSGAIYQIFPVDGTQYLYSTYIRDFIRIGYAVTDAFLESLNSSFGVSRFVEHDKIQKFVEQHKEMFQQYVKEHKDEFSFGLVVTNKPPSKVGGEVLLYGPSYYAIKVW